MRKLLAFIAACLLCSSAAAWSESDLLTTKGKPYYGRWFCNWCQLSYGYSGSLSYGEPASALSEALAFIKKDVNEYKTVLGFPAPWQEWQSVAVCDGVGCVQLYYRFGNWYFMVAFKDDRSAYKNAPAGSLFNPSTTPGTYLVEYFGHYETVYLLSQMTAPVPGPIIVVGIDTVFIYDSVRVTAYDYGFSSGGSRKVPIY